MFERFTEELGRKRESVRASCLWLGIEVSEARGMAGGAICG